MKQQRTAGPDPGMCGCDRDIFLRVWSRVMPEEGDSCPITVDRAVSGMAGRDTVQDDFPHGDDVPCLGAAAREDTEQLQEFISRELNHWQMYRQLARRSGQNGRMLSSLACNCRRRAKRLSAAMFLVSGIRVWPTEQGVSLPRSYFGTLRELFLWEQNSACAYRAAAEGCGDPCLRQLYLDLAGECTDHAGHIRTMIENA